MTRSFAVLAVVVAIGCGPPRDADDLPLPLDSASVTQARGAADALGGDLVTMLGAELKRGGPAAAVAVCADSAQARTARHQSSGITIRRVGTRVRNPLNAPDSTESDVLAAFATAIASNRAMPDTAFMSRDANGQPVTHYLRAIRLQEFCVACHGPVDSITPAVRQLIATRYPDDRATGYLAGELRGAISVTVRKP